MKERPRNTHRERTIERQRKIRTNKREAESETYNIKNDGVTLLGKKGSRE